MAKYLGVRLRTKWLWVRVPLQSRMLRNICVKVFKNGPNKICGKQSLKKLRLYGPYRPYHLKFFKGCLPQILPGPFLNTLLKERLWHKYFSCEFCKIFKNTFFHRTPPVAAFANDITLSLIAYIKNKDKREGTRK